MKYIFTIESSTLLSENDCNLLQKEFHDAMIKHFKEDQYGLSRGTSQITIGFPRC